jgi:amino acid permease
VPIVDCPFGKPRSLETIAMDVSPAQGGPPREGLFPKMDNKSEKSVPHSSSDVEKQSKAPEDQLQRKLSGRHLQFVAIGKLIAVL